MVIRMRVRLAFLLAVSLAISACNEEGIIVVNRLTFEGVQAVDEAVLRSVLATKENARIPIVGVRFPWVRSKQFFDRSRFDADLLRIQAFYADRGYPDARVASFDVKLNDAQDAVDVTLKVDEGQPITVESVSLKGFEVLPADHLADLQQRLGLVQGKPRDRQAVVVAHDAALSELRDHGYPYARVVTSEEAGPDGKTTRLEFSAEPGTLARFGAIEIVGNASVGDDVIRRQLTLKPGEVYRRSLVQDTQRRLYAMELFQFVNVEALTSEQQQAEVPMRVTVAEGRHQRVNGGIGYGTEEKGRVDAEYRHVNFLGGARTFSAHGRYSALDRGIRAHVNQPYFFQPRLSLDGQGQRWYTETPAYHSVVTGAKLSLVSRPTARTSFTIFFGSDKSSSSISQDVLDDPLLYAQLYSDLIALGLDPVTGSQEGILTSVGYDVQHTATDNLLNPRRGYQIGGHYEEAGFVLPGTFDFRLVSGDARAYLPMGKSMVLAGRVQFGNIWAKNRDLTEVPFSKKYFLGGATSIRGWGRYEISPLGEDSGLPVGGNSLLAGSAELRATIRGSLGGVLFIDAGNVWEDRESIDLGVIRTAVGAGLRYSTPVGPVRFDFGYQLNPIDGLIVNGAEQARPWRVHFSIGQAF